MILGHHALKEAFDSGIWKAYTGNNSLRDLHIGPNSIDVTIGPHILKPVTGQHILVGTDKPRYIKQFKELITLRPGEFLIGCTQERFNCTNMFKGQRYVQMYEGRSTFGRLGIASHITAGFGDYGFEGAFTLELYNHSKNRIQIPVGTRVGQVFFVSVDSPITYTGSYSGHDHYNQPLGPAL